MIHQESRPSMVRSCGLANEPAPACRFHPWALTLRRTARVATVGSALTLAVLFLWATSSNSCNLQEWVGLSSEGQLAGNEAIQVIIAFSIAGMAGKIVHFLS
mmetsp:Transcript_17697/g.40053  ORF Transcript_17697/g.40053 Transcript_17697/m.40053 type:complete len:102 (-) Transcript_17697:259-564(-)